MEDKQLPQLERAQPVADALGVSVSQVYSLAKDGDLKSVRIGRSLRFDPDDVRRFVDERRARTGE
jgi:excisionase family DNA binding protein